MSTPSSTEQIWLDPRFEDILRRTFARHLGGHIAGKNTEPTALKDTKKPGVWMLIVGIALIASVVLSPCTGIVAVPGGGLLIGYYFLRRRGAKQHEPALVPTPAIHAITRGRLRLAIPLMINAAFLEGKGNASVGLCMAAGDDLPDAPSDLIDELMILIETATASSANPDERALAALMEDETYRPNRRRRIPESLTRGSAVYVFDTPLRREDLVSDFRRTLCLPVLVEPGETGGISVVPHKVVLDALEEAARLGIHTSAPAEASPPLDTSKPHEAMFAAVLSKDDDALRTAIKNGADVNAALMGTPLLSLALQKGTDSAVDIILDQGADPRRPGTPPLGLTPLHTTAVYNRLAAARRLIAMGADTNAPAGDPPNTPLAIAVRKGHHGIARLLLEAGANPNCDVSTPDTPAQDRGRHALAFAATKGDTEMMKLLLDRGANANHWPQTTVSPLMDAVFAGQFDAVELLVDRGAIIELASMKLHPSGVTAVHMAAVKGHKDIFDFLVSRSKMFQGMSIADFTKGA